MLSGEGVAVAGEMAWTDCPYSPEVQIVISELTEKFTFGASLFAAAAETHHIPAMPPVDAAHFLFLARALAIAPSKVEVFIESLHVLFDGLLARYAKYRNTLVTTA